MRACDPVLIGLVCTQVWRLLQRVQFGAKNTTQMNYLADAVQHGAHIFTHVSVQTVEQCTEGGS